MFLSLRCGEWRFAFVRGGWHAVLRGMENEKGGLSV